MNLLIAYGEDLVKNDNSQEEPCFTAGSVSLPPPFHQVCLSVHHVQVAKPAWFPALEVSAASLSHSEAEGSLSARSLL